MSVIERFIEIPIVGSLLLLPVIPWLYAAYRGTPQVLAHIFKWSRSHRAAFALAIVFLVGVGGNQIIDIATENVEVIDPKKDHEATYKQNAKTPQTLAGAEHIIGTRSEYAREYFDRHRMFIRIDRAAACGALLLLVSMFACQLHAKLQIPVILYVCVLIAAVAFGAAYYTEVDSFWATVVNLHEAGLAQPLPDKP
jgi:hypothetical protein